MDVSGYFQNARYANDVSTSVLSLHCLIACLGAQNCSFLLDTFLHMVIEVWKVMR